MVDRDGFIASWSHGAERLKGYRADEVLGKNYSMFFRSEDIKEGLPQWQLSRARIHGRTEEEGWRVRKDGSVFWANIILTRILSADGTFLGYAKVTRDITERRRLFELERSVKRLEQFVSMIGHELRGPLAPIRYSSTILQERGYSDEKERTAWRIHDRQLALLTRLLDGLMDVGRVTSGKLHVSPRWVPLRQAIELAVETFSCEIEQGERDVSILLPNGEIWAHMDELRIIQVLHNLLSNAIKFTKSRGHIEIRCSVHEGRLHVEVKDDGIGMESETLSEIFTLFVKGKNQEGIHRPGLGVGLALSKMIIEMHGGNISATSPGIDRGSVFRFEIPRAEVKRSATNISLNNPPL